MFVPGATVKTFTTKNNNGVVLRLAAMDDVAEMLSFINTISSEDTFIRLSGEQLTLLEEEKYVKEVIEKMQKGDMVKLVACIGPEIVGIADLERLDRRSRHVGSMSITIAKAYRRV